jgi:hypothetical protein
VVARVAVGPAAVPPVLAGGAIAAIAQISAAVLARRAYAAPFARFVGAWALGMGLRFSALIALAAGMLAAPTQFPPLPTALGFLGVLIPLLLLEIRLTR